MGGGSKIMTTTMSSTTRTAKEKKIPSSFECLLPDIAAVFAALLASP
jgi:hypothetical protein